MRAQHHLILSTVLPYSDVFSRQSMDLAVITKQLRPHLENFTLKSMYPIKMKIYEEPVVEIMVICDFNHHNSDFFLSKKKTTLGPGQLGPVCSDLLHKNNFGSFSFF